jgi:outer membrane lipoprotein carrier protein
MKRMKLPHARFSFRVLAIILVLTLPILTPQVLALESIQEVAEAVDEHYNHLHTLQAEFTEIYRGLGAERTETGTLWLEKGGMKKPGKMRWEYRSPEDKLFVSNGKDAWFYLPADHQARRTDATRLSDLRSPLEFLLGKTQLEKELHGLSYAPDEKPLDAGDVVLRGVPQGLSDQVSEMLLEVDPGREIVDIRMQAVDGSMTEYRFSNQKVDVRLPAGWFQFKPPAGTETIEGLD